MRTTINTSILRNILILLLSAVVVIFFQMAKTDVRAEDDIDDVGDSVDDLIADYHEEMNDLFNGRIKALVEAMSAENAMTEKGLEDLFVRLTPPEMKNENGIETIRKNCDSDNLSTYCLSNAATDNYFTFRAKMLAEKYKAGTLAVTHFKDEGGTATGSGELVYEPRTVWGAIGDLAQGEAQMQEYGATLNRIDREIDVARQSLDQALSAYNELQLAFPLHKKYQQVIKVLEKYRDKISDLRKEVEWYPVTFLDLTTTACT